VERGVYFDGWFPRQHCYHPSLPPRRRTMVEDLASYRATMLVWSALGGGVVSLPYLEEEAHGQVPSRFRFYGFLNDAEFIAECRQRGITVFGVVFEHAWEFPVELNDDENEVLALNETRGAGKTGWLGLREFWQNRYPKLWPSFESYFPGGILTADGEPVVDPLEECAQRNIHGEPLHALWIEVPGAEHYNIMMERNNVVWREYLKGVIRTQIDAGVEGIEFDEAETPITSLQYGGCFCHTCMKGFREFLQQAPSRPAEFGGDKPVVVVENPYGGVVPELLKALQSGREFDRFRLSIYEAAALGVNMSLPYGSWMGSEIKDAFYAPDELCVEAGSFLADHEDLYAASTYSRTGLIFSAGSAFRRVAPPDLMGDTGDNRFNRPVADRGPFWTAAEALSDAGQVYDVVYFPDDALGADHITSSSLDQYSTIVLSGCTYLTDGQVAALSAALDRGAQVIAAGDVCDDHPEIINHPGLQRLGDPADVAAAVERQLDADGLGDAAFNIVRLADGDAAIHLIRYDYDPQSDSVPTISQARLEVRLPEGFRRVTAISPTDHFAAELEAADGQNYRLRLGNVPLYAIVRMSR
jgi:hypothetical protein